MRIRNCIIVLLGCAVLFACSSDDDGSKFEDEVLEFVFFENAEYLMNELTNSVPGDEIELQVQMLAAPRNQDILVSLNVTGENTQEGIDYEIVSTENIIIIPAGATSSADGFRLRTINNNASTTDERKIFVSITTVSDADLRIGERPTDPEKSEATVTITDDECSDTIAIFNNAIWEFEGSNTVYYSDYAGSFTTRVNGDIITITGDIANYDVGISIMGTLVPNSEAPTTGAIVYEPSTIGNDDTYDYRWVMGEAGSFDICGKTIELSTTIQYIDINGPDPTAWVDWYTSTITANMTSIGGTGPAPPSGSVVENISAIIGESFIVTGSINDVQGLSSISIQNPELAINENIVLSGEMVYDLNEMFTLIDGTDDGDYTIEIVATNIESLSTTFTSVLSVTSNSVCNEDYTLFGDENLTANISFTQTDGSFEPYDYTNSVTTSINGDMITISGDIIDFFEIQLTVTMMPDINDVTIGAITFTEEDLGTYTDGYNYRLIQVQEGSYDTCAGIMNLFYDLEYEDAGSWVFFYRSEAQLIL
jgi:hypothetical protein